MNNKISFIIILLPLVIINSCTQLKLNPNAFYRTDFPISLNNYWEYERVDSLALAKDTVRMTIVESEMSLYETDNLWKLLWRKSDGTAIDSNYLKIEKGNLLMYEDRLVHIGKRAQYNFPFKEGSEWDLSPTLGVYTVKDNQFDTYIFGQDYGEAFHIERDWLLEPGDRLIEDILMVKGVGITRRAIKRNSFSYQVYQLIDYHVE